MKAGELLKQYGWIQGAYGSPDIGYCLVAALCECYHGLELKRVIIKIAAKIPRPNIFPGSYPTQVLAIWNDKLGQTKDEVINMLEKLGL